ncbi:MAG: DivIVA domain-containing protein, partial [Actinomycetota bacterium]|nr:DivIVA domain-containing protein [Actinomycetota bacterium]
MASDEQDLLPLQHDAEPVGFDVVLRGYDRHQVDDYLDRVDASLSDADARHASDGERIRGLERELGELRAELDRAQQRAEGRPEPASLVGERLTRMLALAEEEAAELRTSARRDADALL